MTIDKEELKKQIQQFIEEAFTPEVVKKGRRLSLKMMKKFDNVENVVVLSALVGMCTRFIADQEETANFSLSLLLDSIKESVESTLKKRKTIKVEM